MSIIEYLKKSGKRAGFGLSHEERMTRLKHQKEVASMKFDIATERSKIAKLRGPRGSIGGLGIRFRSPEEQRKLGYSDDLGFGMKKIAPAVPIIKKVHHKKHKYVWVRKRR